MQAYEVSKTEGAPSIFAGDLASVRQVVRTIPKAGRSDARIYLVAFPSDKAAMLRVLNGQALERQQLRGWYLSARGRLLELTAEQLAREAAE